MSWGTVPEGLLRQAIQAGVAGGATFVASAGNGNQRVAQNYNLEFAHYPSSWPEVISVGATDGNGHRWVDATDPTLGSNYGVTLDLTAPGKDVLTISFSSPTQTAADSFIGSGTSFSAAIVSGAAALLLANYPTMRSEQVQAWLRQTAVDLVDPENTGATLAGEDFYSGAGLVNVGFALTRGTPDPVVVSLAIERPWYQDVMGVDNAVGATPDLALRVEGPWVGSWRLDIGEGDWPASWTAVPVPAAVAAQPINVGVQTDTSEADVDNGHRYLDTHLLSNRRLYTLRLSARDSSRNAPQYPAPLLGTFLPSLPSATRREITLTVWSGNGTATVDRQRITTDWSNFPAKPGWPVALPPRGIANGYRSLLRGIRAVDLGGGTRRILVQVDGHFVCIRPDGAPVWDQPIDLRIDYGGEDGNAFPAFVVDDVDGDGTKEILVSGLIWDGLVPHVEIRLLRPDGTSYGPGWPLTFPTEADGLYWEAFGKLHVGDVDGDGRKEIIFYEKAHNSILIPPEARGIGKIHVVRLDGTPAPGWPRQFMVPQGRLAVGNLDGDTADEIVLDAGDGFIAFDGNGSVLSGWPAPINRGYQRRFELTQLDAGPELELLYSQIGANSDRYEVGVIEHFGRPKTGFPVLLDSQVSRAPGEWPRANPSSPIFAQAAQVIPGGDPEIVVAYDKVQVLNPNGTIATAFPMIDLGAQSLGLQVLDLDHDGSPPEFVIPVLYWQNDDGYIQPAYEDLVAYRRNGTAVANPSWPVHLQMPFWFNHTAPAAHVADIDGDGRLEVIHARIPMNVDEAWIDAFEIR